MCSQNECVFYDKICDATSILESKIKYRKAVVLSTENQNLHEFKGQLLQRQINAVEIFLRQDFLLNVDNVCQLFNVNEDVRAVITFEQGLIDVAKYLSSIMDIPCFIFCTKLNRVFYHCVFIRNDDKIDRYYVTNKIYLLLDKNNLNVVDLLSDLVCACISLCDILCARAFNSNVDLRDYDKLKRLLTCVIAEFKNKRYQSAQRMLCDFYLCLSSSHTFTPAYMCLHFIAGRWISSDEFISLCKSGLEQVVGLLKKPNDSLLVCDYSQRIDQLTLISGLDRAWLIKGLRKQLSLPFVSVEKDFFREIKCVNKILYDGIKHYNDCGHKIKPISEQLKQAVRLCGDLPFGVNFATLIREISCE